ncbi:MAG: alpha/beta hydrolase [Anaerolineae bacterium CG_4_9_14_3_um_filter_57_17]|nr:alpha/beta hydrolase [bacterium]NCT20388.1 alpha/beta hydrolase [bacterium]OIO87357.1 MAG: alpha/beta hydrolase [Anaerolineae bacterium CG2_30_57_67]PJB66984.1 MAG: alpha/beta hydrolase [Anaerolineae bacterium CG_4_9_14_3_um_filter_57_17]
MEHTFIQTNGIRLHVVTAGSQDGIPLVLLHGFPEYWGGWQKNITGLASAGFHVIIPDQRGYGQSDVPKPVTAYAMDELIKDILGLFDHFGIQQANLVGHDWGAAVAWSLAMAAPQRVRRLAILNVPHPVVMARTLKKSPRQMLKSWYIAFFQIPGLADGLMRLNHFAGAIAMLKASSGPATFSAEEFDGYRQAWSASGGLTGMINWYRALLQKSSARPRSIRLEMPTLILWGKKDVALSATMAEESLKLCTNGQLIYFDNATHWLQHDETSAVNEKLIHFFGG